VIASVRRSGEKASGFHIPEPFILANSSQPKREYKNDKVANLISEVIREWDTSMLKTQIHG
jgi:hypothetical protein